jgi:hypothetical protein
MDRRGEHVEAMDLFASAPRQAFREAATIVLERPAGIETGVSGRL